MYVQQFWNFHQIRMISTLVHSFKLNFHDFVHLTTSNLETNLDDLYINVITFSLSLLNLVCSSIFIWIFTISHTQRIRIFQQIRAICKSNVHNFSLSVHSFVYSTFANLKINCSLTVEFTQFCSFNDFEFFNKFGWSIH